MIDVSCKKYRLLADSEHETLNEVIRKETGPAKKIRRNLRKADDDGPNSTDAKIVDAFGYRRQTALRSKKFDGEQEARLVALRLRPPPAGYVNWSLKLLADRLVALEIVDSISHETVRRTLKKHFKTESK